MSNLLKPRDVDRGRCLIADDSRMVRRVASRIFRDFGFDVNEAGSAGEAVELCRIRMPKLLLLDWHISARDGHGFDGIEVMKKVRALAGGDAVKIIFCTTEREPARIIEALQAGADEYIMKPFDSDIVESKLVLTGLLPPRKLQASHMPVASGQGGGGIGADESVDMDAAG